MPGFVNPDETESRRELYKDLLSHLNKTIWGEKPDLPYSESGKYTLGDYNPVEAFDKERYPEGLIYKEPSVPITESIAKVDAIKMLAKGAKQIFGKDLKRITEGTTAKEGWEVISSSNIPLREGVRDIIRAARGTPQHLLDPLKRTDISAIPEEKISGLYWPRGSSNIKANVRSIDTPMVEVDPRMGNAADSWFHEIGHGRHLDANRYKSISGDEPTVDDLVKDYMGMITKRAGDTGNLLAQAAGKRFYWENPKEIVARDFAKSMISLKPGEITPREAEHAYGEALHLAYARLERKAPTLLKKVQKDVDELMDAKYYGLDWRKLFNYAGARDDYELLADPLSKYWDKSDRVGPAGLKKLIEDIRTDLPSEKGAVEPLYSRAGGPGWQSRTLDWLAGRLGKAPKQATAQSWSAKAKQAGLPPSEREALESVLSNYAPNDRVGADNLAYTVEWAGKLPTQGIETKELSQAKAYRYQKAQERLHDVHKYISDRIKTYRETKFKNTQHTQQYNDLYERVTNPEYNKLNILQKQLYKKKLAVRDKAEQLAPRWSQHSLDEVTSHREILYKQKGSTYKNPDIETHYPGKLGEGLVWHQREGKLTFPEGESTHLTEQQSDLISERIRVLKETDDFRRANPEAKLRGVDEYLQKIPLEKDWYKTGFRDLVNRAVKEDSKFISWDAASVQKKRWPAGEGTDKFFDSHYDQKLVNFVKKEYGVTPEKINISKPEGFVDELGKQLPREKIAIRKLYYTNDPDSVKFSQASDGDWYAEVDGSWTGQYFKSLDEAKASVRRPYYELGYKDNTGWNSLGVSEFDSAEQAKDFIRYKYEEVKDIKEVWRIPVTEEIKRKVLLEGQYFSKVAPSRPYDIG